MLETKIEVGWLLGSIVVADFHNGRRHGSSPRWRVFGVLAGRDASWGRGYCPPRMMVPFVLQQLACGEYEL